MRAGPTKHGYAAYAPEDIEDAKRRHPAVDLREYAAARDLEFLGSALASGFRAVTPAWREYVFNRMRGVLPGGEYGLLEHELDEVPVTSDGPQLNGEFYAVNYTAGGSSFFGLGKRAPRNEPFAASAAWIPATRAATRLPEAALVPPIRVLRKGRFPPIGNANLADYGLRGRDRPAARDRRGLRQPAGHAAAA